MNEEKTKNKPGPKPSKIRRKAVGFKFSDYEVNLISELQDELAEENRNITRSETVIAAVDFALKQIRGTDKPIKKVLINSVKVIEQEQKVK